MTLAREGHQAIAAPTAGTVASVEDLRMHFESRAGRVHAVDGVSFDVYDGENLGLVGETGCGKSVTARSFLRLVPMPPGVHAGGTVLFRPHHRCSGCSGAGCEVCGDSGRLADACTVCEGSGCAHCLGTGTEVIDLTTISLERMREIRGNNIAMIFQDPGKSLNPALPIREQVAEVFYQHRAEELFHRAALDPDSHRILRRYATQRASRAERFLLALPPFRAARNRLREAVDDMVAEALTETQIPNPRAVMDRYPHELSGGMQQRVMIAQALACNPDLLIADEPTTALDVTVQARILELIRDLQSRHRTSVLYISHDLSLVRRVCDRVAVMYAGRIVEMGPTETVFRKPLHPYTRGLLAAIPTNVHERGKLAAIEGTVPELIEPSPSCRFIGRCPYEAKVCREFDPSLTVSAEGHEVACFIYDAPAGGVENLPSLERRVR